MRLNKFLSQTTNLSRRSADQAILDGRVKVNDSVAIVGQIIQETDVVSLDDNQIIETKPIVTIMLNKPIGYVCSRAGQGNDTIYDLLPEEYQHLNPVGRLDKNSSGLLLLSNDGELANKLTHPKYKKQKIYEAELSRPLNLATQERIYLDGIELDDGISKLGLKSTHTSGKKWQITMSEGRNRQIRRTFEAIGNKVTKLHRTNFGSYELGNLAVSKFKEI
jgi:23S rRNA pseudouridine2605 synthase